ncbi:MAG: glycine betaine/L-proline ABC transporter substrate-binding protein ProX [Cyanobacteria bacterium P01_H01_bin.119]
MIGRSRWKILVSVVLGLALSWGLASSGLWNLPEAKAAPQITIARATWDTGWFQTEIFRALLAELGYSVSSPQTLENAAFYQAVAAGEVDLWANGWFPSHNQYLEDSQDKNAIEILGFEVPGGALQGYLIDQATAERLDIRSLGDLVDPEIAAAFDQDGDGKADLIGCNPDWGCADTINQQLADYGLSATVSHRQGDYTPLLKNAIARYRQGQSLLFYTWTPNWPLSDVIPGQDVVWLEVPFASLPPAQKDLESEIVVPGVPGCVADPCAMGFPPNDIRAVANRDFLVANPAVRSLLEQIEIPLADITAQNADMLAGKDSEADIRSQAQTWIAEHRQRVDQWLATARAARTEAAPTALDSSVVPEPEVSPLSGQTLRVVTKQFEPFVMYENQQYSGFSIDLWEAIAADLDIPYTLSGVNSLAKLLDDVRRGAADIAMSGIGITAQGEAELDFSHAFFEAGLQVMVANRGEGSLGQLFNAIAAIARSPRLYYGIGILVVILLGVAHILWISEHRHNDQFASRYLPGIWDAFWWAAVTVTTVGYGDRVPKRALGRFFGLVWMFAGYFVLAYFTATIASSFTVSELQGNIQGPEDLSGKRIATIANSAAAEYLSQQPGLFFRDYPDQDAIFEELTNQTVDAVVYDAPVLQHYASHAGEGRVKVVGPVFHKELRYGIAMAQDSPYREAINASLLKLIEIGKYDDIYQRWFGRES